VTKHLHPPIFDTVGLDDHLLFVQTATEDLDELFEALPEYSDSLMSNNDK
jgi:hypothetical protein